MSTDEVSAAEIIANTTAAASLRGTRTLRAPVTTRTVIYRSYRVTTDAGAIPDEETGTADQRRLFVEQALYALLVLIGATTPEPAAAASNTSGIVSMWQTWIGTLHHLCYRDQIDIAEVQAGSTELPREAYSLLYRWMKSIQQAALARMSRAASVEFPLQSPIAATDLYDVACQLANLLRLPSPGDLGELSMELLGGTGRDLQMYAYHALVMFLCGHPVSVRTEAIAERRPRNLETKFNRGAVWVEISGPLKMSPGAYSLIGQAWDLDPAFRVGLFRPMIPLLSMTGNRLSSVTATMIGLLPLGQMSHIKIISDFLKAYPDVVKVKCLRAELAILKAESKEWLNMPASTRPFAKILYRDMFKLLDGRKLARLTGLAVSVLAETNPTVSNYAVNVVDPAVQEEFDEVRALELNDEEAEE